MPHWNLELIGVKLESLLLQLLISIAPVLFGVGVEMDHTFGSRWLVTELSKLGFSVTYDEVVRYKQSVLHDDSELHSKAAPFPENFTQFVADNVDHNVATLNGKGTFHGMGIMAVSTKTEAWSENLRGQAVKRVKRASVLDVVNKKGVLILQYHFREKQGLSLLSFIPVCHLRHVYSLPLAVNLDLLWSSGWLFPDAARPKPSWSGFMQHVCIGDHSAVSQVSLLPIIDLNPTDPTCIYSTLCFVDQQAKQLRIETPCITFDQPLWQKAVDIITATKMNMVCRLGGFHMMMSFIGSVGSVMSGSGLSAALELVYGLNAVAQMITGKAVYWALHGFFMVDAALSVKLMRLLLPGDKPGQNAVGTKCLTCDKLDNTDLESIQACYDSVWENRYAANEESNLSALMKLDLCFRV